MAVRVEPSRIGSIVDAIWRRDPTIFGAQTSLEPLLRQRYGWLDVATKMRGQVGSLDRLRRSFMTDGKTNAVVLGMGGSALAAVVMRETFGERPDGLTLSVLDSTHPDAITTAGAAHPPASSVFIVASKSGTTTEPRCFQQRFWRDAVSSAGARVAQDAFIAITDPGSQLGEIAARDGYRRTFINPPDIGGRYSALSYFGLVPGALAGYDIHAILDGAEAAMARCRNSDVNANPGAHLGAFLAENAAAGRNKLTLYCPAPFSSLGIWIEQLIAESLGKGGRGILPIDGEPLASPAQYGPDRMVVAIDVRHARDDGALVSSGGLNTELDATAADGTPVLRLSSQSATDLGWLFFVWEFATTVAGALLGIEPFDQPDVERAKVETRRVLAEASGSGVFVYPEQENASTASSVLADAIAAVDDTGYIAVQAYLQPTDATNASIAGLRERIAARTTRPVTTGYGPRFLHSTGQLHKGGPVGLCVQLVDRPDPTEVPIPGEWFGFGHLITAQALGDFMALRGLGRPVLRLQVPSTNPSEAIDTIFA
jgi:glucose-6-phosphate isomerase